VTLILIECGRCLKLKSGAEIERFTEQGIKFSDGVELAADVVVVSILAFFPNLGLLVYVLPSSQLGTQTCATQRGRFLETKWQTDAKMFGDWTVKVNLTMCVDIRESRAFGLSLVRSKYNSSAPSSYSNQGHYL
jgi:hypothetical protein